MVIVGGVTSGDLITKFMVVEAALPYASVAATDTLAGPSGALKRGNGCVGSIVWPLKVYEVAAIGEASVTVAVRNTVAVSVYEAPAVGLVIVTEGGVRSGGQSVKVLVA